jgi:hypothetical protein
MNRWAIIDSFLTGLWADIYLNSWTYFDFVDSRNANSDASSPGVSLSINPSGITDFSRLPRSAMFFLGA